MALLDRVESYDYADRRVVAVKAIAQSEPVLRGHFPGHPVFPGTLVIEALAQTSGILMNIEHHLHRGVRLDDSDDAAIPPPPLSVLAESKIVQRGLAYPGDIIRLEARVVLQRKEFYNFRTQAMCRGEVIAEGTINLAFPAYMPEPRRASPNRADGGADGSFSAERREQ
jgi:3-hydroxyacyl-[acyl-carrier-protein] dehydratase